MRPPTLSTTMTVARMRQRHAVGGASVEAIIDEIGRSDGSIELKLPPTACRWRILATVIVVESVGGLMYAFGIYSARLKSKFSLSQQQLDAISISSSLGSNVGVHWGLLTDAAGPGAALCAALVAGGEYAPPAEYAEDDPDGALRRAICPRNPTADICRSQRDRKRQNDSPCKVPLLNACLVWKEGASRDVVLKR